MKVFLFAGEASGDSLGASLLAALEKKLPEATFYGVGGPLMRAQRFSPLLPMEEFQVMGFSDVLKALPRLRSHFKALLKNVLETRPEAVVLIDYAEWNMRFAKCLRKKGYPGKIIQYVCPTVWAWRKKRIQTLAHSLDLLLTLFPFEKACFSKTSLAVEYVGHPLTKQIPPSSTLRTNTLALFPGSRLSEIKLNLPLQLEVAKDYPHEIAISVAKKEHIPLITALAKDTSHRLVPFEQRYGLMQTCQAALATSGTVTLELALHNTPTIVTYKLGSFNYLLGRYLFRINLPFYSLPNLLTQERLFPEFVAKKIDTQAIKRALDSLLKGHTPSTEKVRALLQDVEGSEKAAIAVFDKLMEKNL